MWVCVHALSGLALGTLAPLGVALTILGALVLHLLLDLVPHWDYTRDRRRLVWAGTDVVFAVAAVAALTGALDLPVRALVAAAFSALPDLDVFDALLPGTTHRRWFPSHWRAFPHGEVSAKAGIPVQVFVVFASITAVLVPSL